MTKYKKSFKQILNIDMLKKLYWNILEYKYKKIRVKLQKNNNPEAITSPVFLTGCARSGTTITAKTLAKSYDVNFFSDGNVKAFNNWYLRDYYTIYNLIKKSYAKNVIFHTNNELLQTPYFLERYPKSKAIFIFRNYMDVINSTIRNRWEWVKGQAVFDLKLLLESKKYINRYKIYFDILNEKNSTNLLLEPGKWTKRTNYSKKLETEEGESLFYAIRWLIYSIIPIDDCWFMDDRIYILNYEKLVKNPSYTLKSVCKFLGIEYSSNMQKDLHQKSINKNKSIFLPEILQHACESTYRKLCEVEEENNYF